MCLPESVGTALGHADVAEMSLVLQLDKSFDGVLKGNVRGDAGDLEQVHFLVPAESLVDRSDAAPEVLRSEKSSARHFEFE